MFSTSPLQSFQYVRARAQACLSLGNLPTSCPSSRRLNRSVGSDGVKGSWFAGIPKRVTVNGAYVSPLPGAFTAPCLRLGCTLLLPPA